MTLTIQSNLFVVGAAKAGTTTIFDILSQHPDVFCPKTKEPKYFSYRLQSFEGPGDASELRQITKTLVDYNRIYEFSGEYIYKVDASADYLYFGSQIAPIIFQEKPEAKIIISLRDPVERSFSSYVHMCRDLREDKEFLAAIDHYDQFRKARGFEFLWDYIGASKYSEQVPHFTKYFGDNVLFVDFNDLKNNQQSVAHHIFDFLGVRRIEIKMSHSNYGGIPKSKNMIFRALKYNGKARHFFRVFLQKVRLHTFAQHVSRKMQHKMLMKLELTDHQKQVVSEILSFEEKYYKHIFNK